MKKARNSYRTLREITEGKNEKKPVNYFSFVQRQAKK